MNQPGSRQSWSTSPPKVRAIPSVSAPLLGLAEPGFRVEEGVAQRRHLVVGDDLDEVLDLVLLPVELGQVQLLTSRVDVRWTNHDCGATFEYHGHSVSLP